MSDPSLDPVSVVGYVASALLGPQVAYYVGPYSAILIGSFVGCFLALRARDPTSTIKAGWFVLFLLTMSAMLTVPLAIWMSERVGWEMKWLFFPLATLIAGVGERWFTLPQQLWDAVKDTLVQRLRGTRSDKE